MKMNFLNYFERLKAAFYLLRRHLDISRHRFVYLVNCELDRTAILSMERLCFRGCPSLSSINVDSPVLLDAKQNIERALSSIQSTSSSINKKYRQLGTGWSDSKYRSLGDTVQECNKALNSITKTLLQADKFLLQLIKSAQEYESISLGGVGEDRHTSQILQEPAISTTSMDGGNQGAGGIRLNEFGVQSIESVMSWITSINPNPRNDPRRSVNCGQCAAAVYKRLSGEGDVVAGLGTYSIEEMNSITGRTQTSMTPEQIERHLVSQGAGAHAVVGVDRASGAGHWFNAYYDGHRVCTIDGQGGLVEGWPPDYGNVVHWDVSV